MCILLISHSYVSHVPDFYFVPVKKKSYYCKYTRVTSSGHLSKLQTLWSLWKEVYRPLLFLLNPMYMMHGVPFQYP